MILAFVSLKHIKNMELREYIVRHYRATIPRDAQTINRVENMVRNQLARAVRELYYERFELAHMCLSRAIINFGILDPTIFWDPLVVRFLPSLLEPFHFRPPFGGYLWPRFI